MGLSITTSNTILEVAMGGHNKHVGVSPSFFLFPLIIGKSRYTLVVHNK